MKFQQTPIALAAVALFAGVPFAAQAAPTVSITSPANNASIAGTADCGATASDSSGVASVNFRLKNASGLNQSLGTDTGSPYTCKIASSSFTNGTYTFEAIATAKNGTKTTASRSITIANGATGGGGTGGGTTNPGPTVTSVAPANGATVSKTVSYSASASDSNGVTSVQFKLDGTVLKTDTTSPYSGSFDSTKLANGSHSFEVVATDKNGAKTTVQNTITVNNAGTTNPVPVVNFTKPANNTNVAAGQQVMCNVTATDANGIAQVDWYLDGKLLNTEKLAPYDTCKVNTTGLTGAHVIKAVATDTKGAKGEAQVTINVGGTGGGASDTTPPSVNIMAPAANAKLAGKTTTYQVSASDTAPGTIKKVDTYLVFGTTQKLVGSSTSSPAQGTIDTTGVPNGPAKLMAVATDSANLTSTIERNVTVENTVPNPDPTPDPNPNPGQGTDKPSTNVKAVATFESLGMYWKPGSSVGAAGCNIRYRKTTESAWKEGLAMWYDSRDSECRGSLVHLEPGTNYAVEMGVGGNFSAGINTKTWSEEFPIAQTIHVTNTSTPLVITQGGTANGYVLYTPAPGSSATIDVANAHDYNVKISAPYVIVRGLTLKNSRGDGVLLTKGAKDVVLEDNDISNWGRPDTTGKSPSSDGWVVGENGLSAIAARCGSGSDPWLERLIVQRNKIHHPRYGASSWSDGHPWGPNGILFKNCGGNHVMRYNEFFSSWGRYFNDIIGGGTNFTVWGMPTSDSDIYGNIMMNNFDDAIESEGGNMQVRIWGNYMDMNATTVSTTPIAKGPVYIWRNVWNRNRNKSMVAPDSDARLYMFKSGSVAGLGGGRRYVFHNTMLQAPPAAGQKTTSGGGGGLAGPGNGQNLDNTMSRNNIFHIWKDHWNAIYNVGTGNDLDYDMMNGGVQATGQEAHRIVAKPTYRAGHGWASESGGNYQLQPGTPGHDQGARIPNFNDGFTGAAPDMGAHEGDTPPMRLGVNGGRQAFAGPTDSGTTTAGGTVTTGGGTVTTGGTTTPTGGATTGSTGTTTTGGTTASSGVCSNIFECAALGQ